MNIVLGVTVYFSKLLKEIFLNKALRGILLGMTYIIIKMERLYELKYLIKKHTCFKEYRTQLVLTISLLIKKQP